MTNGYSSKLAASAIHSISDVVVVIGFRDLVSNYWHSGNNHDGVWNDPKNIPNS